MLMSTSDLNKIETLFLVLNDKTRLRLLALLADGPVVVGHLAERLRESQPKVSRHLAYMRNAGFVYTKRDGKWIYYGILYPEDESLRQILQLVVRSIAAIGEDDQRSHVNVESEEAEDIFGWTDVNDDILTIVGPIDEEMIYGSDRESDEMDVFLL